MQRLKGHRDPAQTGAWLMKHHALDMQTHGCTGTNLAAAVPGAILRRFTQAAGGPAGAAVPGRRVHSPCHQVALAEQSGCPKPRTHSTHTPQLQVRAEMVEPEPTKLWIIYGGAFLLL